MFKIYNTLTRNKDKFKPIKRKRAGVYTCGPTVYDYAHIGNLRSYIFADVLIKTLKYNGFKTKWIVNITDVGHLTSDADTGEDKLEKGSKREGKSAWEIARFYENAFKVDWEKLNLGKPDKMPRATDHIKEQIKIIKKLVKKGVTYRTFDGIYFDTSKINDYGKLSGMDLEKIEAGKRVELGEKKNPTDFALWKFSPNPPAGGEKRQMEWKSPWGVGFPGWHIECSAMSMKYLGKTFDIHTGGIDHIPIHHTNEIAQSETATGKPYANYWVHGEFLVMGDAAKMAKSGENFITLQTLIDRGFNPLSYRYMNFLTHYRKQLKFSWEAVEAAENGLNNLYNKISNLPTSRGEVNKDYKIRFTEMINNDLNMPGIMALIQELLDDKIKGEDKRGTLLEFDRVLGLDFSKVKKLEVPKEIKELAESRIKARQEKNWQLSDELRDEIQRKGFVVEDTADGYKIKKK